MKQSNVVKLNNVFNILVFDSKCNKHIHMSWGKCTYIYFFDEKGKNSMTRKRRNCTLTLLTLGLFIALYTVIIR